jgi:hypothetical protein
MKSVNLLGRSSWSSMKSRLTSKSMDCKTIRSYSCGVQQSGQIRE